MREPADRDRRFPAGPEILSIAVLVLAALLIAAALAYAWVGRPERVHDGMGPGAGRGSERDHGELRR